MSKTQDDELDKIRKFAGKQSHDLKEAEFLLLHYDKMVQEIDIVINNAKAILDGYKDEPFYKKCAEVNLIAKENERKNLPELAYFLEALDFRGKLKSMRTKFQNRIDIFENCLTSEDKIVTQEVDDLMLEMEAEWQPLTTVITSLTQFRSTIYLL